MPGVVIEQPEFINELSGMKNLKILSEIKNVIHDDDINVHLKSLVCMKNVIKRLENIQSE